MGKKASTITLTTDDRLYLEAQTSVVPDDSEEEPQAKSNSPAQIAILIALCLLVPILAALILKPKSGLDPD